MSDLTAGERRRLERAFGMGGGYVLDFTDRTFADFFQSAIGLDIYADRFSLGSGSKANRMRAFWNEASNQQVAALLEAIFNDWEEFAGYDATAQDGVFGLKLVERLKAIPAVANLDSFQANGDDVTFDALARSVRQSIESGEPAAGLDRLHTFVVKYFRTLGQKRGIVASRDKPLHSLVGEYVKTLKRDGAIESEITERILKSTISIMESLNGVRNEQSLAHDNTLLNHNESLLIFEHVAASIRFIDELESDAGAGNVPESVDDLPF